MAKDGLNELLEGEKPPLEQIVDVTTLPDKGRHVILAVDERDHTPLAEFFDVLSVEKLEGELHLTPIKGRKIRVDGDVKAALTQECSVTLEPLSAKVSAKLDLILMPESSSVRHETFDEDGALIVALDDDFADTYANNRVDVAALALEALALEIDPYPKKDDAAFEPHIEGEAEASPFAALAKLKESGEKNGKD